MFLTHQNYPCWSNGDSLGYTESAHSRVVPVSGKLSNTRLQKGPDFFKEQLELMKNVFREWLINGVAE